MKTRTPVAKLPLPPSPVPYDTGPEMRALIAGPPVSLVELPDGSTAWLVTGYNEVREVLVDPRFSRAMALGPGRSQRGVEMVAAQSMLGMDPPEHTRLRRLVAGAFTDRRMRDLQPRVADFVAELIERLRTLPQPVDLVSEFAHPLPTRVICELLGAPMADFERFHGWTETLVGNWERSMDEMAAAYNAITEYMSQLIMIKRAEPTSDLISVLIAARDQGDKLSEQELVNFCFGLLMAGHSTTANQISLSLLALFDHPEQLAFLRANPGRIPSATEELLRFVQRGGGTSIPLPRIAKEDVQLGDVSISAGEVVLPLLSAANRDAAEFDAPDDLDVRTEPRTHLAFGGGAHHCLGAQLARMELREAFRGLLTQLPGLQLAVPSSAIEFKQNMAISSMRELPVTWAD